jgi:glutamate formiminotransferase/formiminotetrahydrofolate cyclodeaminase
LDDLGPFDASTKVVEYRVRDAASRRLRQSPVDAFMDELSTESAVPGGGSVAAVCGALGAALASMVANLTHAPRKPDLPLQELEALAEEAQGLKESLLEAVDRDAAAFAAVLTAMRLPRKSDADRAARDEALSAATREATRVPLGVLEDCSRVARLAGEAVRLGHSASLSDAGVAALCAAAGAEAAYYNVLINLNTLETTRDADFVSRTRAAALDALQTAIDLSTAARQAVRDTLERAP